MRFLIDANCCIYLFSGTYPALVRKVAATATGDIAISSTVFAELALGSANGLAPPPDGLDALLGQIPIVPFDEAAARSYATLPFKRGRFDRLLAFHALSLDLAVITGNVRDFADIPGLRVENWTLPLSA